MEGKLRAHGESPQVGFRKYAYFDGNLSDFSVLKFEFDDCNTSDLSITQSLVFGGSAFSVNDKIDSYFFGNVREQRKICLWPPTSKKIIDHSCILLPRSIWLGN